MNTISKISATSLTKKLTLVYFLFFLATTFSQQSIATPQFIDASKDATIQIRGKISNENGEFRLDYYDIYEDDSSLDKLKELGYHGGGPSWLGIVYGAIVLTEEKMLDEVIIDVEKEGVVIWSKDKNALLKVGRLISLVKKDETAFDKALDIAKVDEMMK